MIHNVADFPHGIAIHGDFPSDDVLAKVKDVIAKSGSKLPLTIMDPPYGNIIDDEYDRYDKDHDLVKELVTVSKVIGDLTVSGGALYVWGGIGKPGFRPFYKFMLECEEKTCWNLSNHITWKKKRGYGIQHNYLFTREELAFFIKGDVENPHIFNYPITREELAFFIKGDIKHPHIFKVPLLDEKRGYAGYNKKYPAKSEFLRRSNVWVDITEILKGKLVNAQKPVRVIEIPIETHTKEGDWVLDTYAGSGTTAIAAMNKNRKFIIVEKEKKEFGICIDRINEWYTNR